MECEGVKPVLAQHCMKFHFPVKWETAEEWAESEGQILLGLSDNLRLVRTGGLWCVRDRTSPLQDTGLRRRFWKLLSTSEIQAGRRQVF